MNTYKNAIEEYEIEDENGKSKLILAYFGLAVYFTQVLEETFSIMLWTNYIFDGKNKTKEKVNKIIHSLENKKTMGTFINEIKQTYSLSETITIDLKTILEKRNYLVHKYFKDEIQKTYSDLGRREMLEYFGTFIDDIKKVDKELNEYYSNHTKKMGLTDEKIEKLVSEMKNSELERETTANKV